MSLDKNRIDFIKEKTFWTILIVVPTVIMLTFFFTTCNTTCQVEKANEIQQEEKKYRDRFIQTYENKFQKRQLQLKDSLNQKTDIDSIFSAAYEENKKLINSLFEQWNEKIAQKHNNLVQLGESADKNFAIWLAVIAAICTVLPVVLALNQNQSFNTAIKITDESINKIDDKTKKTDGKIIEQTKAIEQLVNRIEITALLDIVTQNLNILKNIQELESGRNVHLLPSEEVKFYCSIICESTQKCMNKYSEISKSLNDDEIKFIFNASLCTLCTIRDVLCHFENVFKGKKLMLLQQVRNDVSIKLDDLMNNDSSKISQTNSLLGEIHRYSGLFSNLFESEEKQTT